MQNQKSFLRAAQAIHSQLESARTRSAPFELPDEDWSHCQIMVRRIRRAHRHGWHDAAQVLRRQLDYPLRACAERLQEVSRQVSYAERPSAVASVRDIFDDITALAAEYEDISVDVSRQTLSVTTSPIVLEDIDLGPFAIRLSWAQIGLHHPYAVIAAIPNPSRTSEETTHPHVRDEVHCEGDGQISIDKALRAGRLLDFFQIVNRILNSYNPGSAYVALSDWDGVACGDCRQSVDPDDVTECERCGSSLCQTCPCRCTKCDVFCCNECSTNCRGCCEAVCYRCTAECADCSRFFCTECLEDSGLCQACEEKQHATRSNRDETTPVQTQATTPSVPGEAAEESAPAAAAV
jgi:hypothetical protein